MVPVSIHAELKNSPARASCAAGFFVL